jgi:hypothetical protein
VSFAGVEGDFDADGCAAAFEVAFAGVGFAVGFAVEVPTAAAAEANALAAAESVGAEAAGAGDDIGALGNALDAAAAAGPDDAALFLCDELEHPERARAATIVTPISPVTRIRIGMAFPPAGMRPTIDDAMLRWVGSQNFASFHPMCFVHCARSRVYWAVWRFSLGRKDSQPVSKLRLEPRTGDLGCGLTDTPAHTASLA